jgi:GTP-binding protein HflX
MSGRVVGEVEYLAASARRRLNNLLKRRFRGRSFVDRDVARATGGLADELGLVIALLVYRDGEVAYVIVGSKNRVYLPDLGHLRSGSSRLKGVRLIVFYPAGSLGSQKTIVTGAKLSRPEFVPVVPKDLITDLEKLRLDSLVVVTSSGVKSDQSDVLVITLLPITELLLPTVPPPYGRSSLGAYFTTDLSSLDLDFQPVIREIEAGLTERSAGSGFKQEPNRAVLIGVYTTGGKEAQDSMSELRELAISAGITVAGELVQRRRELDPKTVIGRGKLEELVLYCLDLGCEFIVIDRELTPSQLRNVTALTELKIIDRSMLILDIFSQRAKTSEGRLQVELAQLKYSLPRLTDKDSGLSRLTGGIGGRGPGETKLEINRRRVRDRISDLDKRIGDVSNQRQLRRNRRQNRGVPVVAIVGYTNAGKSSLLNALTKGDVFVENKLFATLDPSSRRLRFPNEKEVVFVDTVGFIRELPKELVAAFRATLEEVAEANMLIHLVDISDASFATQIEVVIRTLESLGYAEIPRLLVFNKIDRLSPIEVEHICREYNALAVSAVIRTGLGELLNAVQAMLSETFKGQDPGRFTEIESLPSDGVT